MMTLLLQQRKWIWKSGHLETVNTWLIQAGQGSAALSSPPVCAPHMGTLCCQVSSHFHHYHRHFLYGFRLLHVDLFRCIVILFACTYAYHGCASFPIRSERALELLKLELQGGCEPSYANQEPISGPLQDQQVLLTSVPSFQPQVSVCYVF